MTDEEFQAKKEEARRRGYHIRYSCVVPGLYQGYLGSNPCTGSHDTDEEVWVAIVKSMDSEDARWARRTSRLSIEKAHPYDKNPSHLYIYVKYDGTVKGSYRRDIAELLAADDYVDPSEIIEVNYAKKET